MKKLAALLFILCFTISNTQSQTQTKSAITIGQQEFYEYLIVMRCHIANKIYKAIEQKKLIAFKSKSLTSQYTLEEFKKLGMKTLVQSIQNPDNPYDTKDTTITIYLKPNHIHSIGFENSKILCVKVDEISSYYLDLESVNEHLTNEEINYLNFLFFKKTTSTDFVTLKNISQSEFRFLSNFIFDMAISGKENAFGNLEFDTTYTIDEIRKRGRIVEIKSIPNPKNKGDIYDLIDTVIITEFNPLDIEKLFVFHLWTSGEKPATNISNLAYSPSFKPVLGGLEMGERPMFYIKAMDLEKHLSKVEKEFYNSLFIYSLRNNNSYLKDTINNSCFE